MLELLDIRTLLFAGALVAGVFAPMMFATMRVRKIYPGYGKWACAELAFAMIFLVQALRGWISDAFPVVLGNISICCAMIWLTQGMREFCGERERDLPIYAGAIAYLVAILYFYLIADDFRKRSLLAGLYLTIMVVYAALPLLRSAPPGRRFGYRFTAAVLLVGALIGAFRVFAIARTASLTTIFTKTPINTAYFLTNLIFIVGIIFSFFLLTNERYVADLHVSNAALTHEVKERQQVETALRVEMTQRMALADQLKELVVTDALTGVLNRRGLMQAFKREIQRADRFKTPLTVLALDLDHFKQINDTFGHAAGDEALKSFATICQARLRRVNAIGRPGGEEFTILLSSTNCKGARTFAETLRLAVEANRVQVEGASIAMTVSIGIAVWTPPDPSGECVLAEADRALYAAKNAGRNCICVASSPPAQPPA